MERPDDMKRDPFQLENTPVRDRPDLEVHGKDPADQSIVYKDLVEDKLFYIGSNGNRVDA